MFGAKLKAEPTLQIAFEPQPDITAYELARIVQHVSGFVLTYRDIQITRAKWLAMPLDLKRHWKEF